MYYNKGEKEKKGVQKSSIRKKSPQLEKTYYSSPLLIMLPEENTHFQKTPFF